MTDQTTMTVRALQDPPRYGVIKRTSNYLLVNVSVIENGRIVGIVTAVFRGDEIPTTADLEHDLIVQGSHDDHPKYGRQFEAAAWAVDELAHSPLIRHRKARKVSIEELRQSINPPPPPKETNSNE